MPKSKRYWMVKQEPTTYPWSRFVADAGTAWTGVRNFQARNNLRAMRDGDQVLYYHSVVGKEVVGIASVKNAAYPDPTSEEEGWVCVDLAPIAPLPQPVPLAEIKAAPEMADLPLLKQSRLSVMPLTAAQFRWLLKAGGVTGKPD